MFPEEAPWDQHGWSWWQREGGLNRGHGQIEKSVCHVKICSLDSKTSFTATLSRGFTQLHFLCKRSNLLLMGMINWGGKAWIQDQERAQKWLKQKRGFEINGKRMDFSIMALGQNGQRFTGEPDSTTILLRILVYGHAALNMSDLKS